MSPSRPPTIISHLIGALAAEIRALEKNPKEYFARNIERAGTTATAFLYRLEIKANIRLKDDTKCILALGGRRLEGQVISAAEGSLTISIGEDIGTKVRAAGFSIDETDLLKKLRGALEELKEPGEKAPWNDKLAYRALGKQVARSAKPIALPTLAGDLTRDQTDAIATAFKEDVTYLWGPPGTGKTHTLGALAKALYDARQRVLIVSHTNRAVDGVLEALCDRLTDGGREAMPTDEVVRIGGIARESLRSKYGAQVSLDAISRRWDSEASDEVARLEEARLAARREIEQIESRSSVAAHRKEMATELAALKTELLRSQQPIRGFIRGILAGGAVPPLNGAAIEARIERLGSEIAALDWELEQQDDLAAPARLEELQNLVTDIAEKIKEVNDKVAKRKESFLGEVSVVAASTTSAFLRAQTLKGFDAVLIDEASMVPLPVSFYLSGMARKRVVIAGDFRQLPPIVHSKEELVKKWYGTDAFFAAGVVESVDAGIERPNLARLTTQFRCHEDLCELINERFYGGRLTTQFTDRSGCSFPPHLEHFKGNRIMVIDTSEYGGSGQIAGKSKANLLHAIILRTLCAQLRGLWGAAGEGMSLGVISPYRAQAELIEAQLHEAGLSGVAVGTVHRFQGDERAAILIDLTESRPHGPGWFFSATGLQDEGARLMNVALSRAQRNVVIVADLSFLKDRYPAHTIIRAVLDDVEKRALIVRASELLEAPLPEPTCDRQPGPEWTPPAQHFNEQSFPAAFEVDVSQAVREVVIASAYIAPKRVRAVIGVLAERVRAGVSVVAVIPLRAQNGTIAGALYDEAVSMLREAGVTVRILRDFHLKSICIDGEISWMGSLNPLSFSGSKLEGMVRQVSRSAHDIVRKGLEAALEAQNVEGGVGTAGNC